jgi:hypothetical protein
MLPNRFAESPQEFPCQGMAEGGFDFRPGASAAEKHGVRKHRIAAASKDPCREHLGRCKKPGLRERERSHGSRISSLGALLSRGLVRPSYRFLSFGFFLSTVFLILGLGHGDVPPWASGLLLVSFLSLAGPFSDL